MGCKTAPPMRTYGRGLQRGSPHPQSYPRRHGRWGTGPKLQRPSLVSTPPPAAWRYRLRTQSRVVARDQGDRHCQVLEIPLAPAIGQKSENIEHNDGLAIVLGEEPVEVCTAE